MAKRRLYLYLAAASGYIGIGMLLGYGFGDRASNTALWVGIILVLLGALLLGMAVSVRSGFEEPRERPPSSSGNLTDDPTK